MKLNAADHSAIAFACLMTFVNEARKSKVQPRKLAALIQGAIDSTQESKEKAFLKHARHWACTQVPVVTEG